MSIIQEMYEMTGKQMRRHDFDKFIAEQRQYIASNGLDTINFHDGMQLAQWCDNYWRNYDRTKHTN